LVEANKNKQPVAAPKLKEPASTEWNDEEKIMFGAMYGRYGKAWSVIANKLKTRTAQEVEAYYAANQAMLNMFDE
jgi:hypothetical protein